MNNYKAHLQRELLIAFRKRSELANPLIFFVMVIATLPLAVGPNSKELTFLAGGLVWVVALLTSLLSLDQMFRSDYDDGCLEQLLLSPSSLFASVLIKIFAHWLTTGLPLALFAPVLAIMLYLPASAMPVLCISLLLGTACFSLIGAIGAALTVSLRRGGLLISLIVLPLYLPVLIFGSGVVNYQIDGFSVAEPLALLTAILLLSIAFVPLGVATALKISVDA